MKVTPRIATLEDLPKLVALENEAFSEFQRSSVAQLSRSITSPFQEVWVILDETGAEIGAVVLYKYKKVLRIYSVAVYANFRKAGFGKEILKLVLEHAEKNAFRSVTLEVHSTSDSLVRWYHSQGFSTIDFLPDYYQPGEHAFKLGYSFPEATGKLFTKNLVVIDKPFHWSGPDLNASVISVKEYIHDAAYQNNADYRVFNLCSSYKYQSFGYYVSLLASARGQRVIPNVTTLRDLKMIHVIQSVAFELNDAINELLSKEPSDRITLEVFFGQTNQSNYRFLAKKLFQLFETPIFSVQFVRNQKWLIQSLKVLTFKDLNDKQREILYSSAVRYFNKKRYNYPKSKNYKYDLAVLVDPFELNPPSNPEALKKLRSVANKMGVYVEEITLQDRDRINEFDGLFIRQTTNVNHATYELSRLAYAEGLVVIDDPWSILRCSNKIYQNELFQKHKVRTPVSTAIAKNSELDTVLNQLNFPLVLKQPDSAFSLGVQKVNSKEEAKTALMQLFKKTDMVIGQEFLYSEFDWRIGVLNHEPLYACKYYMTKGHWQIYDWSSTEADKSGNHETVDLSEVPEAVLQLALKATALIGDGLYGVDLKFINGLAYVIEVNDNPNIDAGVEDDILKDQLYETLVRTFMNRIELLKNTKEINLINK
jgi:glutathione synthase/RimK-type ligase-like ATP-grasp enzyme/ribosomal protein S18 acetylase RimI-like enzyme